MLGLPTQDSDRGEKLEHYRQLDALAEIVLAATDARCIDVWRRTAQGWRGERAEQGAVELASIGARLSLAAVYSDPLAR